MTVAVEAALGEVVGAALHSFAAVALVLGIAAALVLRRRT